MLPGTMLVIPAENSRADNHYHFDEITVQLGVILA